MAMDKMGLFGDPNRTEQIKLSGDIKASVDEMVKLGQGQVLYSNYE